MASSPAGSWFRVRVRVGARVRVGSRGYLSGLELAVLRQYRDTV